MTAQQQEALEAIEKINNELYIKYKQKDDKDIYIDWLSRKPNVSILLTEGMFIISLSIASDIYLNIPEIQLYCSVHDDRKYFEKSDKYETFYKLIKRKFIEIKEEIYSVKL